MNAKKKGWGCIRALPGLCAALRALGMILMAVGVFLLLVAVPFEVWIALVGIATVAAGFLLTRLC